RAPLCGPRASYGLADRGAGPSDAGRRRARAALAIRQRRGGDPAVSGDPILDQLYIVRAQVELAIGLLEAREASPPAAPGRCSHPADHRQDATNAGGPVQWICDLCDQIV